MWSAACGKPVAPPHAPSLRRSAEIASHITAHLFESLEAVHIPVLAVAKGGSHRSISVVIRGSDTKHAVRTVHQAFNFNAAKINLLVLGSDSDQHKHPHTHSH